MAVVFLARDLRHDRKVALKILRPELAPSLGAERFLREIQVTARLSHPHILPLYDSGEADGLLFYVMPYVEGESLADLMEREGQLSLDQAVRIATEVAEALGHAHSYGIIHRDIKPQNIMLSGGHAVVADFGIARAVEQAGGEQLTETGMAVGTPAYMSPEQVVAAAHVDGRTDIYSLGCVLYEMVVGQPPFTGPTPQAVMARHSLDNVPAPHIMRHGLPTELESVIYCALEKSPADRFHTAGEFADALRAVATGQTPHLTNSMVQRARAAHTRGWRRIGVGIAAGIGLTVLIAAGIVGVRALGSRGSGGAPMADADGRAIAVLYLEDRSRDGSLAAVADGLTEGLIAELARVPGLDVVSRDGVEGFRGSSVARDSVARALAVGTLVDGSVEPAGDRLRVALRLTDGATGVDFARASFALPAADPRAVQDSAVAEVARMLRERLGAELQVRRSRASAPSGAAWTLLQRGERLRKDGEAAFAAGDTERGLAAFAAADTLLVQAAAGDDRWLDPVLLRGQIAYRRARLWGDLDARLSAVTEAVALADRVLAVEPANPMALELRGTTRYFRWLLGVEADPTAADALLRGAREDLERAVQLDPSLAGAHSTLSHLYYQTGSRMDALVAARLAYEADAFLSTAADVLWRLFLVSYDVEQFTQARTWCAEGARRFPDHYRFAECRIWALTLPGVTPDPDAAWRLADASVEHAPLPQRDYQRSRTSIVTAAVLARAELADSARAVLVRSRVGADVDPTRELPYFEAWVRTVLGDDGEAVTLLRQLVAGVTGEDAGGGAEWAEHWWWRGLQGREDFQALVRASR
jgi:serine/threonine-protein kinase